MKAKLLQGLCRVFACVEPALELRYSLVMTRAGSEDDRAGRIHEILERRDESPININSNIFIFFSQQQGVPLAHRETFEDRLQLVKGPDLQLAEPVMDPTSQLWTLIRDRLRIRPGRGLAALG